MTFATEELRTCGCLHTPEDGAATLALIERMIARIVGKGVRVSRDDLRLDWKPDILWWGPSGIGASYTQSRYIEQHCEPFEAGLEFVKHDGHETRIAEGNFGGFLVIRHSLRSRPAATWA